MSDYLDPNNEELLKDFFVEAQMQVEILEQNILVLENDTNNREAVDEIFRAAHTLKGAAATVQMDELAKLTHLVEDVLDEIRNDKLSVDGDLVDILLNSIDVIKDMLEARSEGIILDADISDLEEKLQNLLEESGKAEKKEEKLPKTAGREEVPAQEPAAKGKALSEYEVLELQEKKDKSETLYSVNVLFDESNPMNSVGGVQVFAALKETGNILKTIPDFDELYEDKFHPEVTYYLSSSREEQDILKHLQMPDVVTEVEIEEIKDIPETEGRIPEEDKAEKKRQEIVENETETKEKREKEPLKKEEEKKSEEAEKKVQEAKKHTVVGSVLRVESRRIDELLNLVSEAVINKASYNQISAQFNSCLNLLNEAENQFKEKLRSLFDAVPGYIEQAKDGKTEKELKRSINSDYGELFSIFDYFEQSYKAAFQKFRSTTQNLSRVTSDLQEGVMRIRMVPISNIFSRFPRLVRDLSKSLSKTINLNIEGEETELDKSVIEDLLDPLIHCVRNSIDHGIESPEERGNAGKPEEGQILLKASNEGNMIMIEISDDGKGIDVDSVREKAKERGVIHPNKVLSDLEAFNLIFDPGFSTAKKITNISGRGVGLDVVKKQIEKLNGNVSVWSEKGKGTSFTIKIPLTLAIIQGLLVRVGKEMYAIPITSVLESHRIRPYDIKMLDNYEVFNVREDVISLLRLNRLFKIDTDESRDYYFVVIVGSGEKKVGLIVDSLIGEEDVVIKPLKDHYTNTPGIAGANITGDGSVSLIIDVSQLLELGLKKEKEERRKRETTIW